MGCTSREWIECIRSLLLRDKVREMDRHDAGAPWGEVERAVIYWHVWMKTPVIPWGWSKNEPVLSKGYSRLRSVQFPTDIDGVAVSYTHLTLPTN